MIKFLHAADLHLDSPFAALLPEQAAERRREQRALLWTLVRAVRTQGCQLLLLAGDLFDSADADPGTLEVLMEALADCPARVFIAPGNHDCCLPGSAYLHREWPDNVHIFKSPAPEAVTLPELGCRVWGAGFSGARSGPLLSGFRAGADGLAEIMVLHGDAVQPDSPYCPVTREQIEGSGLTYLALGHIHMASGLRRAGETFYAWPGCAMGRGFDETGVKGCYAGCIENGSVRLEFQPLEARRYEIVHLDAGDDPEGAVLQQLPERAAQDIYRIIFTGESEPLQLSRLQQALENRFYALQLRDETRPKRALWAGMEEDTLRGLFLRRLFDRYQQAQTEEDRRTVLLAARLGAAAMEGREDVP